MRRFQRGKLLISASLGIKKTKTNIPKIAPKTRSFVQNQQIHSARRRPIAASAQSPAAAAAAPFPAPQTQRKSKTPNKKQKKISFGLLELGKKERTDFSIEARAEAAAQPTSTGAAENRLN
ncbi:LOW QUALITY PROTEIN: hypothetical protein ENH_00000200 [Eimeria necatrix]|uniref:Uncharacterized protein n=1 Tax=Eimeria necatrix TaxID=51315 RepID=U6MPU3_9EIME|nr:LOW QUALITY PROTEIN: hypothetical protein ENH_00000200 [Eimeria necatrix]CDJ65078.1 hypothetical protein ENH_00000200 [Eimeria necatrix]